MHGRHFLSGDVIRSLSIDIFIFLSIVYRSCETKHDLKMFDC